ncbi:MAG: hypothetical protein V4673_16460 [Pseudomonadota bacterium]
MTHWTHLIRDVADFPKSGIVFLDTRVVGAAVLIELTALRGRERWTGTAPLKAALVA